MPGILDDLDNDMWRFAKSWGTSYHPGGKWMTVLALTWCGFEDPSFQEPPVCCVKNCACHTFRTGRKVGGNFHCGSPLAGAERLCARFVTWFSM